MKWADHAADTTLPAGGATPARNLRPGWSSGDRVGRRYRLRQRLGSGGMGEVWRATDEALRREVAVKLLRPGCADRPARARQLRLEARYAAVAAHPGVPLVYDVVEPTDAEPYIVMELVRGEPLSTILARIGCLSAKQTLELLVQTAAILAAVHAHGIVHRDIKPGNLLVSAPWTVKLADFGLAESRDTLSVSCPQQILGTPRYLAPELMRSAAPTPASDIYSLGAVAYECLSGQPMYEGDDHSVALAHLRSSPRPLPPTVPAPLRDLVMRALAKDPVDRPSDGGAFADAVDAASVVVPTNGQRRTHGRPGAHPQRMPRAIRPL